MNILEIAVTIAIFLVLGAECSDNVQRRESTNGFGEHHVNKLLDILHAQKGRMYDNVASVSFNYNITDDESRQESGSRGKGKGKGNSVTKKSKSGRSSKQKCKPRPDVPPPSAKGKGKGSGSKGGKSSKGNYIECNQTETFYPTSTMEPTLVPGPTSSPSNIETMPPTGNATDNLRALTPYFLSYDIEQTRIPSLEDFSQLQFFTNEYLKTYFGVVFGSTNVSFADSLTEITGSEFRLGQPVRVDYNTSVTFLDGSEFIPEISELDAVLASAFEGDNAGIYASAIADGLPTTNIFSTTTSVSFTINPPISRSYAGAVGLVAGSAFVLLSTIFIAVSLVRRAHSDDQDGLQKLVNDKDHITVAGDTYICDDTVDSRSYATIDDSSLSIVSDGEFMQDVTMSGTRERLRILHRKKHFQKRHPNSISSREEHQHITPQQLRRTLEDVSF